MLPTPIRAAVALLRLCETDAAVARRVRGMVAWVDEQVARAGDEVLVQARATLWYAGVGMGAEALRRAVGVLCVVGSESSPRRKERC